MVSKRARHVGDSLGSSNIDPRSNVKLRSLGQIRHDQRIKAQLNGEVDKQAKAKVTLPKLKFMERKENEK